MEATASLHAVYMHKRMSIPAVNLLPRTTPVYGPRVRDLQRAARHSHEDMLSSTSRTTCFRLHVFYCINYCIYVTTPIFATVSSLGKRSLSRVSAHPPSI